ncbi:hypothetical protein BHE74_00001941 [Ensete ventricosum]|nr:hypothetical protein BHE74_00001941 [Ensete ventricosum]RZS26019.1 hypothetical protein BHM03_00059312 [Ensete ventricosum]
MFSFCNLGYDFLAHQVQLIRIQLRVPEYGWTTQKLFHLMNVVVNGRTSSFGCFGLNFFRLNFLLHINYHMDLQCARFCLVSIKTCFLSNQSLHKVTFVCELQICIWAYAQISPKPVATAVAKLFLSGWFSYSNMLHMLRDSLLCGKKLCLSFQFFCPF